MFPLSYDLNILKSSIRRHCAWSAGLAKRGEQKVVSNRRQAAGPKNAPSGCLGRPEGCDCRTSNCTLSVEWRGSSKDTYSVILSGGQPDAYMAVGWPAVASMGPAPVIVCAAATSGLANTNNNVTAIYWNTAAYASSPAAASSPGDLVNPVSVEVVDGLLKCSLEVKASFQVANATRDLNTEAYFVILSTGSLKDGQILPHTYRVRSPSALYWADSNSYLSFNYDGCPEGGGVGCEGLPLGCVAARNCSVLLRLEAVAADSYQFSLSGPAAAGYLALGLSMDTKMGDDSVVACIPDSGVVMYWNSVGNSTQLPNTTVGMSNGTLQVADGTITCSFLLQASI